MDTKILEKIGLSKNESISYLTLLKIGTSTSGELIKRANLNSGRIYDTLESLKNKGLVSENNINNIRNFTASSPKELLNLIEIKKNEINDTQEKIKKIIPELDKLRTLQIVEPKSIVYTGFNGFKTAVDEATKTLKENDEVLTFGIRSQKSDLINKFWQRWTKFTEGKNLTKKYIFTEKGDHYEKTKALNKSEIKFLNVDTPLFLLMYLVKRLY